MTKTQEKTTNELNIDFNSSIQINELKLYFINFLETYKGDSEYTINKIEGYISDLSTIQMEFDYSASIPSNYCNLDDYLTDYITNNADKLKMEAIYNCLEYKTKNMQFAFSIVLANYIISYHKDIIKKQGSTDPIGDKERKYINSSREYSSKPLIYRYQRYQEIKSVPDNDR